MDEQFIRDYLNFSSKKCSNCNTIHDYNEEHCPLCNRELIVINKIKFNLNLHKLFILLLVFMIGINFYILGGWNVMSFNLIIPTLIVMIGFLLLEIRFYKKMKYSFPFESRLYSRIQSETSMLKSLADLVLMYAIIVPVTLIIDFLINLSTEPILSFTNDNLLLDVILLIAIMTVYSFIFIIVVTIWIRVKEDIYWKSFNKELHLFNNLH